MDPGLYKLYWLLIQYYLKYVRIMKYSVIEDIIKHMQKIVHNIVISETKKIP